MKRMTAWLAALLAAMMLPIQAAVAVVMTPKVRLEPVAWLDADAAYTLIAPKTPIVADPATLALAGGENGDIGDIADTEQTAVSGQSLLEQGLFVLSVSPDGERILCTMEDRLFVLTGSTLRAVALNLSRCAAAPRVGLLASIRYAAQPALRLVGSEGFRWSPDGKYICLLNAEMTLQQRRSVPLMLIDAGTGEMFSIRAYYSQVHKYATAMQAVFSRDSRYLYYTEYVEKTARLCRYGLDTGEHELLADTRESMMGSPALGMNEKGGLCCFMSGKSNNLITFREENGRWTFEKQPVPTEALPDFAAAGQGMMFEVSVASGDAHRRIHAVKLKGKVQLLSAKMEDHTVHLTGQVLSKDGNGDLAALLKETAEAQSDPSALEIVHMTMSPDGSRYLMVLKQQDETEPLLFAMLDPGLDSGSAFVFELDAMEKAQPELIRGKGQYAPGLVLLSEDLLLIPEENGTRLFRIVAYTPRF